MTPERLKHFRELLVARQQELLADKKSAEESTRPVALDQSTIGRVSRSDALQGQAMAIESQRRRDLELRRIQIALARIDSDDFGLCVECDEEIAIGRLEIDPATTRCIDCAAEAERR